MTLAEYDQLFAAQGGVCAICKRPPTRGRNTLDVDHCHDTGRVRGLLCSHCNRCIGLMANDPSRLRGAADYLGTHAGLTAVTSHAGP